MDVHCVDILLAFYHPEAPERRVARHFRSRRISHPEPRRTDLMDFDWTPEQLSFRKTVRSFLAENLPPDWETRADGPARSEEHTSALQSLMRISYALFCFKK